MFEPNFVYVFIRGGFRILFKVLGSWNIKGHENIPQAGPVIIISNHASYMDPPLMGSAVQRPVAYMAKHDLFTGKKWLAWVCRKLGAYPVKQGQADREALQETFHKLASGRMIGIFPEGHRSPDNHLQEFQAGLSLIALRSRAPIIPCGFAGTYEMLPAHAKGLKKSHIEVHFGPALQIEDVYQMEDKKAASAMLLERAEAAVLDLLIQAKSARDTWYLANPGER